MQFIESMELYNFIKHHKTKINFGNIITVISGENGAGKTLIMDGLMLLLGVRSSRLKEIKQQDLIGPFDDYTSVKVTLINPITHIDKKGFKQRLIPGISQVNGAKSPKRIVRLNSYLDKDLITVTLEIKSNGTSRLMLGDTRVKRSEFIETLKVAGINPESALMFTEQTSIDKFISENDSVKFEGLIEATGLVESKINYIESLDRLEWFKEKSSSTLQSFEEAERRLGNLRPRYEEYLRKQELQEQLNKLESEREWSEIKTAEKETKRLELRVTDNQSQIKKERDTINESEKSLKESEEVRVENKIDIKNYELNIERVREKEGFFKSQQSENIRRLQEELKPALDLLLAEKESRLEILAKHETFLADPANSEMTSRLQNLQMQVQKLDQELEHYDKVIEKLEEKMHVERTTYNEEARNLLKPFQNKLLKIDTEEKHLKKRKNDLKMLTTTGKQVSPNRKIARVLKDLQNFRSLLNKHNLLDRVIGPVYSLIDIENDDELAIPLNYAFIRNLQDFIARDEEAFSVAYNLAREASILTDINLGLLETGDFIKSKSKPEDPDIIDYDLNLLNNYTSNEVIAYISKEQKTRNLICRDSDERKLRQLAVDYNCYIFTLEGTRITQTSRATIRGGNVRSQLYLGQRVDTGSLTTYIEIEEIDKKLEELVKRRIELKDRRPSPNRNELDKIETNIKDFSEKRYKIVRQINKNRTEISQLEDSPRITQELIDREKAEIQLLEEQITSKQDEITKLKEKQLISVFLKGDFGNLLQELRTAKQQLLLDNDERIAREATLKANISTREQIVITLQQEISKLILELEASKTRVIETRRKYKKGKVPVPEGVKTLAELDATIHDLKLTIHGIKATKNDATKYKEFKVIYEERKIEKIKIETHREELKDEVRKRLGIWLRKLSVLEKELNQKMNTLLNPDMYFQVNIENKQSPEKAVLKIRAKTSPVMQEEYLDLSILSAGEKSMAIQALIASLHFSRTDAAFHFLDEFTQRLDEVNKVKSLEMFTSISEKAMKEQKDTISQYILITPTLEGIDVDKFFDGKEKVLVPLGTVLVEAST
ncbi:MAG: AAA family ATPase [Candidatus Hodarchaeales archaeon]|jgi:chromosome segregation ATPase